MRTLLMAIATSCALVHFAQAQIERPRNVLVIMTDDQRWDTVDYMPNLSRIANEGVKFTNAMQPTPLCAPSRSMLLSGGYHSRDTGVLGNNPPDGGIAMFHDGNNIGVRLQAAGYNTMFVGKWVNGYEATRAYVPPGWSTWIGRHSYATNTNWYAFKYVLGSSKRASNNLGKMVPSNNYTTYWERDQVIAKLNAMTANPSQPFFILWAPSAPHTPAQPANEDAGLFTGFLYRGRGVGETDRSDKPMWVQKSPPVPDSASAGDEFTRRTLRALQSVDRSVQAIVDQLKANGQYDNTLVIYTSDNGYMWNEHGLWEKSKPYQESLRVPFIVHMPGVAPRVDASLIAPSLDIGPTLFELADVDLTTDGKSIIPLLNDASAPWRTELYIEEYDSHLAGYAIYGGIVTPTMQYDRYWAGDEELYNLVADPYQLQSIHADPAQAATKQAMRADMTNQLGLAIIPVAWFKPGVHGALYSYQWKLWGGFGPFTWNVSEGTLPPGITLNRATGLMSGVPTTAGVYKFRVRVTDSALSPQTLLPHVFITRVNVVTIK